MELLAQWLEMAFCRCFLLRWRCLAAIALRLLFLLPVGAPAQSGESFPKPMDNVTVRQGESAVLKCIKDKKVSRVAWLNRTTILFAGQDKWSLDPRVILLTDTPVTEYSIRISDVDVYDEGPYICSILSNKKPKSSRVHLIVQVPARIVNISRNMTVNEGSNIRLMCLAAGRPEPSIAWRHLLMRGNKFLTEGEYVEITAITKEQSGIYECTSTNDISAPDVRTVHVTVNYPPSILSTRATGVSKGQQGILQCEASAVPGADFQWYREGRRINSGLNGIRVENTSKKSRLVFFNVSEEHYGNYTCVATNILGNTNASMILYGPGAVHDVSGARMTTYKSLCLLWTTTVLLLNCF